MSAELEPMQENAPAAPTFDFGADDQTNALLLQDAQTFIVGTTARIMAATPMTCAPTTKTAHGASGARQSASVGTLATVL